MFTPYSVHTATGAIGFFYDVLRMYHPEAVFNWALTTDSLGEECQVQGGN